MFIVVGVLMKEQLVIS